MLKLSYLYVEYFFISSLLIPLSVQNKNVCFSPLISATIFYNENTQIASNGFSSVKLAANFTSSQFYLYFPQIDLVYLFLQKQNLLFQFKPSTKYCEKSDLLLPSIDNCLPDHAELVGNYTLGFSGGQPMAVLVGNSKNFQISLWKFSKAFPNRNDSMSLTLSLSQIDNCPIFGLITYYKKSSFNLTSSYSVNGFMTDVQPKVLDPNQFMVPDYCVTDKKKTNKDDGVDVLEIYDF
ncbi:hypothetical protein SNEBB_003987 [Seison nebaliae]|nr:hypothetical protein SNEBB_003987 [Seison nebaliae]